MASNLYGDSSTDIETLRAAIASNTLPKQRLYDESEFAGSESCLVHSFLLLLRRRYCKRYSAQLRCSHQPLEALRETNDYF